MFCTKCGKPIPEGSHFCPSCGNRMDGEAGGWQSPPAASQNAGGDGSNGRRDKGKGGKKALIGILVFLLVAAVGTAGFFVIRTLLGGQEEQEEITAWNNDDGEGEDALTDERETVPQEESGSGEDGTDASGGEPFEAGSAQEGMETAEETGSAVETEAIGEMAYDPSEGGIHRYEFYVEDCSWSEAFAKAQEKGGYLVHINSQEEYDAILSQIEELEYGKIQFYLGSCRDEGEHAYYWRDAQNRAYGERIDGAEYWCAAQWLDGEPSFAYEETQEDCINMYYNSSEGRWVWNDIPNDLLGTAPGYSGIVGYIVEYEGGTDSGFDGDDLIEKGAGEFDASGYVNGVLRNIYFGDSFAYREQVNITEEEAREEYEEGLSVEADFFMEYCGIPTLSDDVYQELKNMYRQIYQYSKFEVKEALKDGVDYQVEVLISPIDIISKNMDGLSELIDSFTETITEDNYSDEQEVYDAVMREIIAFIKDDMDNLGYEDQVSVMIMVEQDVDGYYGISSEAVSAIDQEIIRY